MERAKKMCAGCPFRNMTESEKYDSAVIEPEFWPCHEMAHPFGWGDVQCRGHWEVRRKYPPTDDEAAALKQWQDYSNKALSSGVPIDEILPAPVRKLKKAV